jgi:hypothetical protein
MVTNPAILAGAAGIIQIAMQQQMHAIMDYLATIDGKLDDVLRAQTNQCSAAASAHGLSLDASRLRRVPRRVDPKRVGGAALAAVSVTAMDWRSSTSFTRCSGLRRRRFRSAILRN